MNILQQTVKRIINHRQPVSSLLVNNATNPIKPLWDISSMLCGKLSCLTIQGKNKDVCTINFDKHSKKCIFKCFIATTLYYIKSKFEISS